MADKLVSTNLPLTYRGINFIDSENEKHCNLLRMVFMTSLI